jgi:Ca2+-transporting ATPase
MNFSICFLTIIGGLTLGRPPLNIVQMLWVNLIMDVLGAIAIATEPYNNHSVSQRVSRDIKKNPLMQPAMWRQIIFMSMY